MRLTWKDGLATALVALAVLVFAAWSADGTIAGISGRGLVVAMFVLGVAGCYTAQSHFEKIYSRNGVPHTQISYVVLISAVGAVATVAGIVAMIGDGGLAVSILLVAMIVLWILSTLRHQLLHPAGRPAVVDR